MAKVFLAIHGGAGNVDTARRDDAIVQTRLQSLRQILQQGIALLTSGSTALNAVTEAVVQLENDANFNAGRGSVLSAANIAEMDAAIMDGHSRRAGAVAGVHHIQNPILGARAVMLQSEHVLMVGIGAEIFCQQQSIAMQPKEYFITPARQAQLTRLQNRPEVPTLDDLSLGTVGAVALDSHGHLAAATSTGGKVNKLTGRVGDSPLIGAGTWADDSCAISATGDGEAIIRCAFAHEIAAQMRLGKHNLTKACQQALVQLDSLGGRGGCIAVSRTGEYALLFNTSAMYRGWATSHSDAKVSL